jgi:threonine dehydrogenase-like Zn-dependent dehydrogenase
MVGCSVAALLARFPGVRVELVDVDPARAAVADALGVGFAAPDDAAGDCDLVVHASATEAGLTRSLELLADEGEVIELSWFGDRLVSAPLGEAFHSRRLAIRASQVGAVSPARRGRRSHGDRMALALRLLADPVFDVLVTREVAFADLPHEMPGITGEPSALCVRVTYQ